MPPRKLLLPPEWRNQRAIERMSLGTIKGRMESASPVKSGLSKDALALASGVASAVGQSPWHQSLGFESGTVLLTSGRPGRLMRWYPPFDGSVGSVRASIGSTATGDTTIDVYKNGSTIFTSTAHRPTIASGQNTALASAIDLPAFVVGDYFTYDVVNVGSPSGADLTVELGGLPILGSGVVTSPTSGYETTILADSPVRYWRMNDASGTAMIDSSGNGFDGTYTNSPTLNQTSLLPNGQGASARYASASSQYATVTDTVATRLTTYSIEAWVKFNTVTFNSQAVTCKLPAGDSPASYTNQLYMGGSNQMNIGVNRAGANFYNVGTGLPLSSGAAHHFVATVASTAGVNPTLDIYQDGVLAASSTDSSGLAMYTDATGWRLAGDSTFLDGWLQEVAVYDYALSSTQVANHYAAGQ